MSNKHEAISKLTEAYLEKIGNTENFSILWYYMHSVAKICQNAEDQQFFSKWLVFLLMFLTCPKCKGHALSYLSDHPFVVKPNDPRNAFRYTVDFHNTVNKRLGKPVMLESTAWDLYTDNLVCKKECGSDGTVASQTKRPTENKSTSGFKVKTPLETKRTIENKVAPEQKASFKKMGTVTPAGLMKNNRVFVAKKLQ